MTHDHVLGTTLRADRAQVAALLRDDHERQCAQMGAAPITEAQLKRALEAEAFEKGIFAGPDGECALEDQRRMARDNAARDEARQTAMCGYEASRAAQRHEAPGALRGHGLDPFSQTEIVTVAVNVRLPANEARELEQLMRADPSRLQRLVQQLQRELCNRLDGIGIEALPVGISMARRVPDARPGGVQRLMADMAAAGQCVSNEPAALKVNANGTWEVNKAQLARCAEGVKAAPHHLLQQADDTRFALPADQGTVRGPQTRFG